MKFYQVIPSKQDRLSDVWEQFKFWNAQAAAQK